MRRFVLSSKNSRPLGTKLIDIIITFTQFNISRYFEFCNLLFPFLELILDSKTFCKTFSLIKPVIFQREFHRIYILMVAACNSCNLCKDPCLHDQHGGEGQCIFPPQVTDLKMYGCRFWISLNCAINSTAFVQFYNGKLD